MLLWFMEHFFLHINPWDVITFFVKYIECTVCKLFSWLVVVEEKSLTVEIMFQCNDDKLQMKHLKFFNFSVFYIRVYALNIHDPLYNTNMSQNIIHGKTIRIIHYCETTHLVLWHHLALNVPNGKWQHAHILAPPLFFHTHTMKNI